VNFGGVGVVGKIGDGLLANKATGTVENDIVGALSHGSGLGFLSRGVGVSN